jgi:biotin-dependent carboxylase-like uncharacterized protein
MITFRKKGMLTTVQDQGRIGYQRYGMPVCGAMDHYAMELANILVGNPRSEAVIEATVMGPTIVFDEAEIFAISGGDFGPTLNGQPIENDRAYLAEAGDILSLPLAKRGARAYIAFAGGLDLEEVMGSRSTFLKGGVGGLEGRAIRDGDRINLRAPCDWLPDLEDRFVPEKLLPALSDRVTVRFTYGPQDDLFSAIGKRTFAKSEYTLSDKSDRMGFRMDGPAVERAAGSDGNIISDGICFGAIQITNGQPIVMMADRQTTGGYPKLGCVITADLPLLAQLKAGDRVRFRPVSVAAAQAVYRRQRKALDDLEKRFLARLTPEPEPQPEPLSGRYLIHVDGKEYDICIEEQHYDA